MADDRSPWKCPECHKDHWRLSYKSSLLGRIEGGLRAKCLTTGCPVEVEIEPYAKPELWAKRIDPEKE